MAFKHRIEAFTCGLTGPFHRILRNTFDRVIQGREYSHIFTYLKNFSSNGIGAQKCRMHSRGSLQHWHSHDLFSVQHRMTFSIAVATTNAVLRVCAVTTATVAVGFSRFVLPEFFPVVGIFIVHVCAEPRLQHSHAVTSGYFDRIAEGSCFGITH